MKLRTTIKLGAAFATVIASFFFVGVALAGYLGSGYFHTNQIYRCHVGSYATQNQNASAKWSATTDLDIYASCTNNNVSTIAMDYGDSGWAGQAYPCTTGGCGPSYLNYEYIYCSARSNTYFLSSWTNTQRQYNATHELGHCWSLAHSTRSTSVMQQGQLSIINPDSDDITDVNNRY